MENINARLLGYNPASFPRQFGGVTTPAPDMKDLVARLERLELQNWRMKKTGMVAIVVGLTVFLSGQAKTNKLEDK
jgi:hypothetical protein